MTLTMIIITAKIALDNCLSLCYHYLIIKQSSDGLGIQDRLTGSWLDDAFYNIM